MQATMTAQQTSASQRHAETHSRNKSCPASGVNVGDWERLASGIVGMALTAKGLMGEKGPADMSLAALGGMLLYRGFSGHCQMYQMLGIDTASDQQTSAASVRAGAGFKVKKSITIQRPVDEVYHAWRKLENLPHIMSHLESVRETGALTSEWTAKGPLGTRPTWQARIINEEPNRLIAWKSVEDSSVDTAGSVHFDTASGRGTQVTVELKYDPPLGKAGAWFATLFGENPEHQIQEDLRRWKQFMEAGEAATIQGQTSCRMTSST